MQVLTCNASNTAVLKIVCVSSENYFQLSLTLQRRPTLRKKKERSKESSQTADQ